MSQPPLIVKIDEQLFRMQRSRRWLSLSVGRGPDYIRDLAREKSRQPKAEDLLRIATALGKPIDYFIGYREGDSPSATFTTDMPVNPQIAMRAELLADMVTNRLVQRRGVADISHEVRGRMVAAAQDALNEAARLNQVIPDAMLPVFAAMIQSLID